MQKMIAEIIQMYQVQGMIAVAFNDRGEILAEEIAGFRDVKAKKTINRDTIFGIASISKSFTALAMMQLVERKIIDLEQPVQVYIPEFKNPQVLVKHLLSHTSGYYPQHRTTVYEIAQHLSINVATAKDLAYNQVFTQAGIQRICHMLNNVQSFCGKSGERLSYSNDGYGLLTAIIARFGGAPTYTEYMETNIFNPLRLQRTHVGFDFLRTDTNVTNLYQVEKNEITETTDYYDNAFALMGGGAIKSTINDLMQYVLLFLNQHSPIIKAESLQQMMQPITQYTLDSSYGYGLSIEQVAGCTFVGHGGSLTGVSSQILWCPEKKKGAIVLCNTSDVPVVAIAQSMLAQASQIALPQRKQPKDCWLEQDKQQIIGTYYSDEGDNVKITKPSLIANPPILTIGDIEKAYIFGESGIIYLVQPFHKTSLQFLKNEVGTIFAVKLGARILAKKS